MKIKKFIIDDLRSMAEMPEYDQDDAHRLRHKAKMLLEAIENFESLTESIEQSSLDGISAEAQKLGLY